MEPSSLWPELLTKLAKFVDGFLTSATGLLSSSCCAFNLSDISSVSNPDTLFLQVTSMDPPAQSSTKTTGSLPPSAFPHDPYPRLSLAAPSRITVGSIAAAVVGFSLGATQGGQTAQLRFRAEHAHKMPDSTAGWYLYHKSKNYHVMQGGISEGFRMAARTGIWSFMALSLESTVDRCRGTTDLFSTVIASLTVAGGFSLWSKSRCLSDSFLPCDSVSDEAICDAYAFAVQIW